MISILDCMKSTIVLTPFDIHMYSTNKAILNLYILYTKGLENNVLRISTKLKQQNFC